MSDKTPLEAQPPKFDLKFLLVGDSGAGKTHLCGTYTKGPVHFYMLDPGGQKTLHKLVKDRPKENPLTVDLFPEATTSYTKFWRQIQKDERSGFFNEMAERNGLVVLPDSISSAGDMSLREVAAANKRTLTDQSAPMRIQDWGQNIAWLKELISVVNNLPCATAMTAHLYVEKDEGGGNIIGRYPLITGQLKYSMGRYFDEVYLLAPVGKSYTLYFKEHRLFQAKSRIFSPNSIKNVTMDILADAYMRNDDLSKNQPKEENESK